MQLLQVVSWNFKLQTLHIYAIKLWGTGLYVNYYGNIWRVVLFYLCVSGQSQLGKHNVLIGSTPPRFGTVRLKNWTSEPTLSSAFQDCFTILGSNHEPGWPSYIAQLHGTSIGFVVDSRDCSATQNLNFRCCHYLIAAFPLTMKIMALSLFLCS